MIRTPERVTCIFCGRYGDVGYRTGHKDGTWLCIVRKTCNRRQRKAAR